MAAYTGLAEGAYDRGQAPPTAVNNFALPTFIHIEEDEDDEPGEGSNGEVSGEEPIEGVSGEEPNGEMPSEEVNSKDSDEETNGEMPGEEVIFKEPGKEEGSEDSDEPEEDVEDPVEGTVLAEGPASGNVGSLQTEEARSDDEQSLYTFEERGEPDNTLCLAQLLPLAITGNEAPRMSPKEFEALGFDEYPPNEWIHTSKKGPVGTRWTYYPKARLSQGERGCATLWVMVNDDGIVGDVSLRASMAAP